ncbi:concanavalin A-like lectin/glucanase domain-containing protein [Paraphysoderma sedebokerense]|nr:concanavalin A-like lectin/glucanase domain-containing protein [Paraphysoderma sedebokerense]
MSSEYRPPVPPRPHLRTKSSTPSSSSQSSASAGAISNSNSDVSTSNTESKQRRQRRICWRPVIWFCSLSRNRKFGFLVLCSLLILCTYLASTFVSLYNPNSYCGKCDIYWADEFNGDTLDLEKWDYEVDSWGGGNYENQTYRKSPENLYVRDGYLHIVPKYHPEGYRLQSSDGQCTRPRRDDCNRQKPFTSARIRTLNKLEGRWRYGRFEVRAKIPVGNYLWPAIWLLPVEDKYGTWAASGEIDIMEARGQQTHRMGHALHFGASFPNNTFIERDVYSNPNSPTDGTGNDLWSNDFHVYGVDWKRDNMTFFVDGKVTWVVDLRRWWRSGRGGGEVYTDIRQPFDQPFYLIMNLAINGKYFWGQYPPMNPAEDIKSWTQPEFIIDYVRVYRDLTSPTPDDNNGDASNGGGAGQGQGGRFVVPPVPTGPVVPRD